MILKSVEDEFEIKNCSYDIKYYHHSKTKTELNTMRFSKVCAFVAAVMVAVVGRSADYVWNSSVSEGEWSDAKNWLVN